MMYFKKYVNEIDKNHKNTGRNVGLKVLCKKGVVNKIVKPTKKHL